MAKSNNSPTPRYMHAAEFKTTAYFLSLRLNQQEIFERVFSFLQNTGMPFFVRIRGDNKTVFRSPLLKNNFITIALRTDHIILGTPYTDFDKGGIKIHYSSQLTPGLFARIAKRYAATS